MANFQCIFDSLFGYECQGVQVNGKYNALPCPEGKVV